MTQSPYQHQDPRRIDLQRLIDEAQRDGDAQRLARLELQWVHRFGVDSLPQSTTLERIDDAAVHPDVSPALMEESSAEAIAAVELASSETATSETATSETAPPDLATQTPAATTDSVTADLKAVPAPEEQRVDSTASPWSALEPELEPEPEPELETEPEPALQADQEQPTSSDSGISRFTALLKDCLDDVGRVVDREDRTSGASPAPSAISAAAPAPSSRPVPASGPRRLRRWLTPVDADDLPKAS